MSFDMAALANDAVNLVFFGILVVASGRGIQIGRHLVNPTFRNRAFWASGVMLFVVVVSGGLNQVPYFAVTSAPFDVVHAVLSSLPWMIEFILLFLFVGSTITVTMEMDFFHRDTLHWRSLRRPLTVAYLAVTAYGFPVTAYNFPAAVPIWAIAGEVVIFLVGFPILGYAVVALLIGARRTPDRTMKSFVAYLGAGLLILVAGLVVTSTVGSPGGIVGLLTNLPSLIPAYLFYRAIMALSPIGKIEREEDVSLSQAVRRLPRQPTGRLTNGKPRPGFVVRQPARPPPS